MQQTTSFIKDPGQSITGLTSSITSWCCQPFRGLSDFASSFGAENPFLLFAIYMFIFLCSILLVYPGERRNFYYRFAEDIIDSNGCLHAKIEVSSQAKGKVDALTIRMCPASRDIGRESSQPNVLIDQ